MEKIMRLALSLSTAFLLTACSSESIPSEASGTTASETVTETSVSVTETTLSSVSSSTSEQAGEAQDISGYDTVDDIIASLTAEEKTGQLLLGRFPGSGAEKAVTDYHIGGFTLYAKDFQNETPDTLSERLKKIQSLSFIPAFMAVDEEGGTVVRVSKFPQYRPLPFDSQIALAKGGAELVESETEEKSKLLASLGINLNLAPVADITDDHYAYIYDRTFGENAEKTAEYAALTVKVMKENNMGSCLKHFPGYGPNSDTHNGIAVDERSAAELEGTDFIPFIKGIEAGAPSVMVCHNIVNAYDSELPASLSPAVHDVLREQLGFEGVIISDDMEMEAILQYSGEESPYVLAVLAGNDLICTSDIEKAYSDILSAVNDGRIEESRLDESVRRILEMKKALGMF